VRGRCFECVLYGHRRRPHRMDHDEDVGQTLPRTQREKSGKKQPEGHARILRARRSRAVTSRKACHWTLLRPQRRDRIDVRRSTRGRVARKRGGQGRCPSAAK
jgi:hypothetical protein